MVFNDNAEGIMIEVSDWHRFLRDRTKMGASKLHKQLMMSMLDEKALFYLSLEGLSPADSDNSHLARVHEGLIKAVSAGETSHLNMQNLSLIGHLLFFSFGRS